MQWSFIVQIYVSNGACVPSLRQWFRESVSPKTHNGAHDSPVPDNERAYIACNTIVILAQMNLPFVMHDAKHTVSKIAFVRVSLVGPRASLLQAKCLPPLIRIRQRLQQAATATATLGTTLERERFRQRSPHSEEMSSAVGNCSSGKGATADQMPQRGSYSPGEHGGDSTRRCRNSNVNVTANGDLQPSLAVIISLVIDKVVDKTPSRPGGSDRRAHA